MADITTGTMVFGLDMPPAVFAQDETNQLNITSTSFVTGDPAVSVTFTAPTSGRAVVVVSAGVRNNSANEDRVVVSYVVNQSDENGTEFQAASDENGISSAGIGSEQFQYGGHATMLSGLTPGRTYYAEVVHRQFGSNNTCDISTRSILVFPTT